MEEKAIILPFSGYHSKDELFSALQSLTKPEIKNLISHVLFNDAVHIGGASFIECIYFELESNLNLGLKIFLDLKIFDVSEIMVNILKKYQSIPNLDILTVSSQCSISGIRKIRELLPSVKLAMVSIPSDITEKECSIRFGKSSELKIWSDLVETRDCYRARFGDEEPFDLVVCSSQELNFLRLNLSQNYGFIISEEDSDNYQKLTIKATELISRGATFVVSKDINSLLGV